MEVTNNHFKTLINQIDNFYSNNTNPPEDLFINFILELNVSNLLIPVEYDGGNITFPHIVTDEGENLLPLFTDDSEMLKYTSDFRPLENDISYYIGLVNDLGFNGIIINCESNRFCIDSDLLNHLEVADEISHDKGFDEFKLKEIAESTSNYPLLNFIRNKNNYNNFDELVDIVKRSVLLAVVMVDDDANRQEIIQRDDAGGFVLLTSRVGSERYALLFTGRDAIKEILDKPDSCYYQIVNLFEVIRFILMSDMDGIIINKDLEEYYIPRNILLNIFDSDIINDDFSRASDYAFML
nr:SseB family protein [uncultured Methanobrevibacter sp.]